MECNRVSGLSGGCPPGFVRGEMTTPTHNPKAALLYPIFYNHSQTLAIAYAYTMYTQTVHHTVTLYPSTDTPTYPPTYNTPTHNNNSHSQYPITHPSTQYTHPLMTTIGTHTYTHMHTHAHTNTHTCTHTHTYARMYTQ